MGEYRASQNPGFPPIHPGEILRDDVLPALKMTVKDAAGELGISRQSLHNILNGSASITPAMALRVGKFCGNGPDIWLRMQQAYDLWRAKQEIGDQIKKIPTHSAA